MSQHSSVGISDIDGQIAVLTAARDLARREMAEARDRADSKEVIAGALDAEIKRLRKSQTQDLRRWQAEYRAELDARGEE